MAILTYNDTGKQIWQIVPKTSKRNGVQQQAESTPVNYMSLFSARSKARIDVNIGEYEESIKTSEMNGSALQYQEPNRAGILYPHRTQIKFNRKHQSPFIAGTRGNNRDVIAVSLDLSGGKRMTSLYNKKCFMYEADFKQGEYVDFVAAIPTRESAISVTIQDGEGNVYFYRFSFNELKQTIFVTSRKMKMSEVPPKGQTGHVNTQDFVDTKEDYKIVIYSPSRPTYTVITAADQVDTLTKIMEENFYTTAERMSLHTYESEISLEKVANQLVMDRYSAVSFYAAVQTLEEAQATYAKELELLKDNFNKVLVITAEGRAWKIKV